MRDPRVVIIGAGMTGIVMYIKMKQAGIRSVEVIEKADKVGGTWRENTYPGVACDIPAHMYAYSFELNPDFSHQFARGDELQAYFERMAKKYGLLEHASFNEEATSAVFKDDEWYLETSKGRQLQCDFLVCATGILHHPVTPKIDGADSFAGPSFHTARWRHDVELTGKKIAYIGTGSTACQAIPELIDQGHDVEVFQRTAQWILPVPDVHYGRGFKDLQRRSPKLMKTIRSTQAFLQQHIFAKGTAGHEVQHALLSFLCKQHLKKKIKDPKLRRKLTPDYEVGCKRLVVNTTFYDAIQKPNASLCTQGIEKIVPQGVVTKDGELHPADVIIYSTGFDTYKFMRPMTLTGRNGVTLDDAWKRKAQAYHSVLIPNFPNFFLMLGPHSPIGNFSVTWMSEIQGDYVLQLIDCWQREELPFVEPTQQATIDYNAYLRRGFKGTAWASGCNSWYLDQDNEPIVWPYPWGTWVRAMRRPNLEDMVVNEKTTTS